MKLGLIARADNTGLGMQTWEFYRAMKPDKTLVVDISAMNGNKQYPERYPDATFVKIPTDGDIREFLQGLDVVFLAEAEYNPHLYIIAKQMGVKVANQYNYEFFTWLVVKDLPAPDMFIAPSHWNYDKVQAYCDQHNIKHVYLHCPVNREAIPFREIDEARTFLHVAGRSAAMDRNGTESVIQASKFVKSGAKIVIHFQGQQGLSHQATRTIDEYREYLQQYGNPDIVTIQEKEFDNYADVYKEGDVMLLPRRYGGNCLPLNEALSAGMPVLMPDISPNNTFLPEQWLIPADKIGEFAPRTTIDIYGVNPYLLAGEIDKLYYSREGEFKTHNRLADAVAQTISWENMKPQYLKAFEELCNQ